MFHFGEIAPCSACGSPLRLFPEQRTARCPQCAAKHWLSGNLLPVAALKVKINAAEACQIIAAKFAQARVSAHFRRHAQWSHTQLIYAPLTEYSAIYAKGELGDQPFLYQFTNAIKEKWSEQIPSLLQINTQVIENIIASAELESADPATLRCHGVLLEMPAVESTFESNQFPGLPAVEEYQRLLYVPLWEVCFQYKGILFKNYLAATNGEILTFCAVAARKKQIRYSLAGLAGIGLVATNSKSVAEIFAVIPFGSMIGLLIFAVICILLVPYFWEISAEQELLIDTTVFQEFKPLSIDFRESAASSGLTP